MNYNNIVKKISIKLLNYYSNLIEARNKCKSVYKNIIHATNRYFIANRVESLEYINLNNGLVEVLTKKPSYLFRSGDNYKINNTFINNSNSIFIINFCNKKGEIVSYIITNKQFRMLSRNKSFVPHDRILQFIIRQNLNDHHINILHSAINNIEITNVTKRYIKSLHNLTVNNFIKFLKIKNLISNDTKNSDLVVMDSDFLEEYIFNYNELILLKNKNL